MQRRSLGCWRQELPLDSGTLCARRALHWARRRCTAEGTKSGRGQRYTWVVVCVSSLQYSWTPLHTAAAQGHVDVVQLLLDNGADLAAKASVSRSAACCCARPGWLLGPPCARRALRLPPSPVQQRRAAASRLLSDLLAQNGWTALLGAVENGHVALSRLLVERGAVLNAKAQVGSLAAVATAAAWLWRVACRWWCSRAAAPAQSLLTRGAWGQ